MKFCGFQILWYSIFEVVYRASGHSCLGTVHILPPGKVEALLSNLWPLLYTSWLGGKFEQLRLQFGQHMQWMDPDFLGLFFSKKDLWAIFGLSYTIPDSYRSDINLRCFPVLSAITTFYIWSFCLIILYYHNFKCQIHLEAVKCDVAPMRIRYRVTGAFLANFLVHPKTERKYANLIC